MINRENWASGMDYREQKIGNQQPAHVPFQGESIGECEGEVRKVSPELSPVQAAAVRYISGPSMVIAGAGSGKTRVLTCKIAYLLQNGYKPWNILALTFTNKAAKEMRERIEKLLADWQAGGQENRSNGSSTQQAVSSRYLYMGTFHSIFARILRLEAEALGYDRNYTIYDDSDSRSLIKAASEVVLAPLCNTQDQLKEALKIYKPQNVANSIGLAKNRMITPEQYSQNRKLREYDEYKHLSEIHNIYKVYQRLLKENNAMDFDDLLLNTYTLFSEHEHIRKKYAELFQFVLVDEYQDTNAVQQKIIELLVREHHRVCVVGDDAQSIYAFRGANIDNILNFQRLFPELKTFKLEENYRSTQSIVAVANDLIRHNVRQLEKNVFSNNGQGNKPQLITATSDREEAAVVCKKIVRLHAVEHTPYDEFAILYRTNAQSRLFEEAFRREGVPYKIYGGMSFYQRAEIKNVLAYFRLVCNPQDDEALVRIINYPKRGIGNTTVQKIVQQAKTLNQSLWETLSTSLQHLEQGLRGVSKLQAFVDLISGFIDKSKEMDAATLGKHIIQTSGIQSDLYGDTTPEGLARQENLQELTSSLSEFVQIQTEEGNVDRVTLSDFLAQAVLQTDQEVVDAQDDNSPKVLLMTMHASKGLEFDCVFVVGLEEEILPSPRSVNSQRALEEERRLLYVAITRAKKFCFLSRAENRYLYGYPQSNNPSRFLKDINPSLLDDGRNFVSAYMPRLATRQTSTTYERPRPFINNRYAAPPSNFRPISNTSSSDKVLSKAAGLSAGTRIEHTRFGCGTIQKIEGTGENTKATVLFDNLGKKQLLLKFVTLKVIG